MTIIRGTKQRMTTVFHGDRALGVTPVAVSDTKALEGLAAGALVAVRGVTKGKGFAGVVKRHGFHGGPKTHGQKNRHRAPGSIGNTTPQRVIPGRRMAGRMGGVNRTIKNLTVVGINVEKGIVTLKGAVPGNTKGEVRITLTSHEPKLRN